MAELMIKHVLFNEDDAIPKAKRRKPVDVRVMEVGRGESITVGKRRVLGIANLREKRECKVHSLRGCLRFLPVKAGPAVSLRFVSEVLQTLWAFENSEEIDAAIEELTLADLYVLMVAIFRCFARMTSDNREKILLWKKKVAAKAGNVITVSRTNKALAQVFDFYFQKC